MTSNNNFLVSSSDNSLDALELRAPTTFEAVFPAVQLGKPYHPIGETLQPLDDIDFDSLAGGDWDLSLDDRTALVTTPSSRLIETDTTGLDITGDLTTDLTAFVPRQADALTAFQAESTFINGGSFSTRFLTSPGAPFPDVLKASVFIEQTPGESGQTVLAEFFWTGEEASFQNELGLFLIDDDTGRVGGLQPQDAGYAAAALSESRRRIIFESGQTVGAVTELSLPGDRLFGWYLIQNASTQTFLEQNISNQVGNGPVAFFSISSANPDNTPHLERQTDGLYGWEDLIDVEQDFNDLEFRYRFKTLTDNTPTLVSIDDVRVVEGRDDTASLSVGLSKPSEQAISVRYDLTDGTAIAPKDYITQSGTLTFAPGETSKTIEVAIVDDGIAEDTEAFSVNLSQAVNAEIADAKGLVTIVDNDEPDTGNNTSPVVLPDRSLFVREDSGRNALNLKVPQDADGDALTVTVLSVPNREGQVTLEDGTVVTRSQVLSFDELTNLQFIPASDANGPAGDFSYVVEDGKGGSATQTITLQIQPVNDAPVLRVPGAQATPDNTPLPIAGISVSDADAGVNEIEISLSVANGTLSLGQTTGLIFSEGDGTDDAKLVFTGLIFNINRVLSTLSYTSDAGFRGRDLLSVTVDDLGNVGPGNALTDSDTVAIAVSSDVTNSPPTVDSDKKLIVQEDSSALPLSISAPVDIDGDTLAIAVSEIPLASQGRILLSDNTFVTAGQSLTAAQLTSLQFVPRANANGDAGQFIYTVDDGQGGVARQIVELEISAVNDAPTLTVPNTQNAVTNTPVTLNGVGINDIDAEQEDLQLSIAATNGVLSLSQTAGLAFITGDGTNDKNLTFTGSLTAINTALSGLLYQSDAGFAGGEVVSVTVNDQGNTGSGGALAETKDFRIEVAAPVASTGEIRGNKWEDINANGVKDGIETGLKDVSIYLDLNNNGQLDASEPLQLTDALGVYGFTGLAAGTYQVREVLPAGYAQTYPLAQPISSGDGFADFVLEYFAAGNSPSPLTEPYGSTGGLPAATAENGFYTIESVDPNVVVGAPPASPVVSSNSSVDWLSLPQGSYVTLGFADERIIDGVGDDLLIRSFDVADAAGESADVFVSADGLSFERLGTVQEGGVATLDLADIGFEKPVSAVRIVGLDNLGSSPGFDLVSVEALSGSTASPDFHTVTLTADELIENINFGNKLPTGEIRGRQWEDQNGNGIQEDSEPAIAGGIVYLDADRDGQLDPNERSAVTNAAGEYRFRDLAAGSYSVREVVPVDFIQTFPADAAYAIALGTGEVVENVDFSNQRLTRNTATNRPPVFTSTPLVQAEIGTEYSYQPTASDPDGNALTFALTSGPVGLEIESSTGLLSWSPTDTQIGDSAITIEVSDPAGLKDTQTFTIAVQDRASNSAPVFVSTPVTEFAVSVPNNAAGEVNPDLISLSLAAGETATESVSITLPGGGASIGGQADIVFVVDESGSMDTEHAWLTTMVLELEAALQARGISDNRYSLIGYTADARVFNLAAQTKVSVYDPGNQLIASGSFDEVISTPELTFDLLNDGTYTVVIGSLEATVPATYALDAIASNPTIIPLTNFNTPFSGTLSSQAGQTFAFRAPAGTPILFDGLSSSSGNIRAQLIDADGEVVFSNVGLASDTVPYSLPKSGDYSLVVSGGQSGGDFSFQLLDLDSAATQVSLDAAIAGQLTANAETQVFQFEAASGQRIYFDSLANQSVAVALYGADGSNLESNSSFRDFESIIPTTGTYTLVLSSRTTDVVDYSFSLVTPETQRLTVAIGETITGSLSESGERDVYQIQGSAGQRLLVDGLSTGSTEIFAELISPSGESVTFPDRLARDFDPLILRESGTYSFVVSGDDAVGDYSFRLLDLATTATDITAEVTAGSDVSATFDVGSQTQLYIFSGIAGQQLIFNEAAATGFSGEWQLYGPDNTGLGSAFIGTSFATVLSADGLYTLAIEGNEASAFNFTFNVSTPVVEKASIVLGDVVSGTLNTAQEQDIYGFSGNAGQRILLDGIASDSFQIEARLVSATGQSPFSSISLNRDSSLVTLPESGDYSVIVSGEVTGNYSFQLIDIAAATSLPFNTDISSTITPGFKTETYAFEGTRGQLLTFDMVTVDNQFNGSWALYGPAGTTPIASNRQLADFSTALPADGTYTLVVDGNNSSPVDYTFNVNSVAAANIAPSGFNLIRSGTLAATDQQDTFTFDATAGTRIFWDALISSSSSIQAQLTSPSGASVFSRQRLNNDVEQLNLLESGTYTVTVTGGTGDYSFRVLNLDDAIALPIDSVFSDRLDIGTGAAVYEFAGTAGQQLSFNGVSSDGSATLKLYGPENVQIATDRITRSFAATLAADGIYTVIVDGSNSEPFDFSVQVSTPDTSVSTLVLGETISGSLAEVGERDIYRFNAGAGQTLVFDGFTGTIFNAEARLVSPTGAEVLRNTPTDRDVVPVNLTESGEYSLIVSTSEQADSYSFRVLDLSDATSIALNTVVSGTTTAAGIDLYQFSGTAGQEIFFDALSASGFLSRSVLGPNNAQLSSSFGMEDFSTVLPADGVYTLVLQTDSDAIDFSFKLAEAVTTTISLAYGETITGALNIPGKRDVYQFVGVAGQQILFDGLDSTNDEILATLASPSSGRIFTRQSLSEDSSTPFTLPESGTYSIFVDSGRGELGSLTGDYSFRVLEITPKSPLEGSGLTGTFDGVNQAQVFQFEGIGGQKLTISPTIGLFGSAEEASDATASLSIAQGGTEDGYLGINRALQLPFRAGAAANIILVTDEDRDIVDDTLTFESIAAGLATQAALLNITVDGAFLDGTGAEALGVDSEGVAYIADGSGGFITVTGGAYGRAGNTPDVVDPIDALQSEYVDLAWDSRGAAWDLNQLRTGGDTAVSFTKAFVNVKASEISNQLSIDLRTTNPNITIENVTGPIFGVSPGQTISFDTRITGDGTAANSEILFVRPDTGFVLGSIPVSINQNYLYLTQAVDPEGDPLTYSLEQAPVGAVIDAATGRIDWTPPMVGTYQFEVAAADDRGAKSVQTYAVEVYAAGGDNIAPTITSVAPTIARAESAFSYAVTATDADSDLLTFFLTEAPEGVSIEPDTGIISWTPTKDQVGNQAITIQVVDGNGGSDIQMLTLTVTENQKPIFSSTPFLGASPGQLYEYDVDATDPDGTAVTYSLRSGAPDGMTIDSNTGLIQWTPGSDLTGQFPITVFASDADGVRSRQAFALNLGTPGGGTGGGIGSTDSEIPLVFIGFNSNVVEIGESLNLQVRAVDNESLVNVGLTANGSAIALTPNSLDNGAINNGTVQFSQSGLIEIVATAEDNEGNIGTQTLSVRVTDPNDTESPFIEIDTSIFTIGGSQLDTTLESLTNIVGTVRDDNLEFFRLEIAPIDKAGLDGFIADDPNYVLLAEGNSNVIDGALGAVDPRKFANGSYFIRAIAGDFSGNINIQGIAVALDSAEKPGQVRLEINDLTIPLAGIPIEITRVYDSFEASESGDFGFGWSLKTQEANIEESAPVTDGPNLPSLFTATSFKAGDTVTLTNPDGERVNFIFDPVLTGASLFGAIWKPQFTPAPGVFDRLEVDDITITQKSDGSFGLLFIPFAYNPSDYRLITKDGTEYSYNQFEGLKSAKDRNGNTLTYTEDGIFSSTGQSITFNRDDQGRIVSITDPAGGIITYSYNNDDDLAIITDQTGTTITHTYDPDHYLKEVIDSRGNVIALTEYDDFGRITTSKDGEGNTTTFVYSDNADGTITETKTDALGNITVTTRDERGNVTIFTDEVGATTITAYSEENEPISVTDALGSITTRTLDSNGNPLSITDALGNTQSFTYDNFNNVLTETDQLGRVTAFGYDVSGNLVTTTDSSGAVTRFGYDNFGRVIRFIDANGNTTEYAYGNSVSGGSVSQALSKPTQVTFPDGTTQSFEYNQFGQTIRITDEKGNETRYVTDSSGRLVSLVDALGNVTTYGYDAERIINVTDALGKASEFEYNDAGQLIRTINAASGVVEYEYDSLGRRIREIIFLDAANPALTRTTTTLYREDGLVASITDANGSTTRFEYDLLGNQTAVIDPLNQRTEFAYNARNEQIKQTDPLNATTTFSYDAVGNLIETVDRNNRRRTLNYSSLDQISQETWWSGNSAIRNFDFTYDKVGNLLSVKDPDSEMVFTYDRRDRQSTVNYIGLLGPLPSVTLNYNYDATGNITAVTDSFGVSVNATYDERNLLTQQLWQGGGIAGARVDYGYSSIGLKTSVSRYTDVAAADLVNSSTYSYDDVGRLLEIAHLNSIGTIISDYTYTLNQTGEVTEETVNGQTINYSYDMAGQLVVVNRAGSADDEVYQLDKSGNRISSSLHGESYEIETPNRLTSDGQYGYQYDGEGNLIVRTEITTGTTQIFEWDHRNRLVAVVAREAGIETQKVEYTYDAFNRRTSETVDGKTTYKINDSDEVWAEVDSAGEVIARYLNGAAIDERIARYQPGERVDWYLTDRLGSIQDIVNSAGAVINHVDYDSFGNISNESNPDAGDQFGFAGREFDSETGLYHNRARYYDPRTGRFISNDPIGFASGDFNLYRYAENNPANNTDPSGLLAAIQYVEVLKIQVLGREGSISGAVIGGLQGFGTTGLIFIGHVLEISNSGGDIIAEWGTAIARTQADVENLAKQLNRLGAFDKDGLVKGFVKGAGVDIINITLGGRPGKLLGLPSKSISLRTGGFEEGYMAGLEYLRSLNPNN